MEKPVIAVKIHREAYDILDKISKDGRSKRWHITKALQNYAKAKKVA